MFFSAAKWLYSQWPLIVAIVGGVLSLIGIVTEKRSLSKTWKTYAPIAVGGTLTIIAAAATTLYQSAYQEELRSTMTGGDSYCHFLFIPPSQTSNTLDLILITVGKYPLYDVSVRITDLEKHQEMIKREDKKGNIPYDSMVRFYELMSQDIKVIQLGNIGPNQSYPLGTLKLPDSTDKQSYSISIVARNGPVVQYLTCRRVNNVWKLAMKTMRKNNMVQENVEPGFPRNDKGQVQW